MCIIEVMLYCLSGVYTEAQLKKVKPGILRRMTPKIYHVVIFQVFQIQAVSLLSSVQQMCASGIISSYIDIPRCATEAHSLAIL